MNHVKKGIQHTCTTRAGLSRPALAISLRNSSSVTVQGKLWIERRVYKENQAAKVGGRMSERENYRNKIVREQNSRKTHTQKDTHTHTHANKCTLSHTHLHTHICKHTKMHHYLGHKVIRICHFRLCFCF